jgi:HSP20 family protein
MKLAYCSPSACAPSYRSSFPSFLRSSFGNLAPFFDLASTAATPRLAVDLYEDDTAYQAVMELPGVKKEDVKVDLTSDTLTITAERKLAEDSTRTFARSLTLPDDVSRDTITAKLEDGILTLTLPKAEQAKPRPINVA